MQTLKTFFYSLKRSLSDISYYKDVAQASFGFSLKYLWFLLMIFVVFKAVSLGGAYVYSRPTITPAVHRFMSYAQDLYPADLELQIKNGKLSTNVAEPYVFDVSQNYEDSSTRHFLTIDTAGSIENYPEYNTYVLATRNAVVYPSKSRNNQIEQTSVFYFNELKQNVTLNRKIYDDVINKVKPYAGRAVFFVDWFVSVGLILFLIFGSFGWTLATLFGLLFMTLIVWVISLIFKKGYQYGSLYKMGMHAVTWPILIEQATKYLKLPIPNLFFLVFLVFMMAIIFTNKEKVVVKSVKSKAKTKSK